MRRWPERRLDLCSERRPNRPHDQDNAEASMAAALMDCSR